MYVLNARERPKNIQASFEKLRSSVSISSPQRSDPPNVLRISYTPSPPKFTIRTIIADTVAAAPPSTTVSVWHPPTTDDMAREMYKRAQRNLLIRLLIAIAAAVPTLIIGVVYMSLVKKDDPGRRFFEERMWAGLVSRGEWAMFILSTPVMFYCAESFHRRALQELWFLWRPGSTASLSTRFLRFGSMNLLISLGVSVAYFASVAELAISATRSPHSSNMMSTSYFDSVVFLTMFLLIGRYIEAFSKHQAANAITLLGNLRGSSALLVTPSSSQVTKIPTDLLEVGDIVRVPVGETPPADGILVSSDMTYFDESSLTGESRNVFVGTVNKLRSVDVRVDAVGGETMLEKVIEAVRQGQTKRAPIERIIDVITSYFAPVIVALAIITWIVWLALGLSGVLPPDTLEGTVGGWPFWSLEFAISVFVIACPCGIGLAAPTALLVGSGLAAKHGILARGGGEAFQDASQIDVVVFDKTGTLTEGREPQVTDVVFNEGREKISEEAQRGIVLGLASASSHPLSVSLRNYLQNLDCSEGGVERREINEVPGCGMEGTFRVTTDSDKAGTTSFEVRALLGNEVWLAQHGAQPSKEDKETLHAMKSAGKSVVLLALSIASDSSTETDSTGSKSFSVTAIFAIADPIRPEASSVVRRLMEQGIETWMISGDNLITATAVAKAVGIPSENVIAGVLPHEKVDGPLMAEKVQWLQSLPNAEQKGRSTKRRKGIVQNRRVVAMVGDGINDAPALSAADVGIAMGSGSDIALSSAKFVLLSSNLRSLLVLTDLSRVVFRRIKFNFAWATIYNLIALPVAAGVIYPAGHARLDPVWSSLAMALSSTSVVCSSLLLRLYREPEGLEGGESLQGGDEEKCGSQV
ncbi:hypothetical protein D9613_009697 [Agrocybe pediades]|uniref:P-type ATPase A domain-containing protein n=1 Tax=Agrocybe pediades TaxID=84607 RepID=A0A8H4QX82_9AGAR|nr:hypothetical protein D9613_009697 [Agrocybe pediades]